MLACLLAKEKGTYSSYSNSLWDQGILPIDSIKLLQQYRGQYLEQNTDSTLDWDSIRKLINFIGISIWLNSDIDIIYNRLKKSKNKRPLIITFNTKQKLEKLLKERILHYQKAHIQVNIINTGKDKMSDIILNQINEYISIKDD